MIRNMSNFFSYFKLNIPRQHSPPLSDYEFDRSLSPMQLDAPKLVEQIEKLSLNPT